MRYLALIYACNACGGVLVVDTQEDYAPSDTALPYNYDKAPTIEYTTPDYCAEVVPSELSFYAMYPDVTEPQTTCVVNRGLNPFRVVSYQVASSGLVGDTSGKCFTVEPVEEKAILYPNDDYCFVVFFCDSNVLSQGTLQVFTDAPEYGMVEVKLSGKIFPNQ